MSTITLDRQEYSERAQRLLARVRQRQLDWALKGDVARSAHYAEMAVRLRRIVEPSDCRSET